MAVSKGVSAPQVNRLGAITRRKPPVAVLHSSNEPRELSQGQRHDDSTSLLLLHYWSLLLTALWIRVRLRLSPLSTRGTAGLLRAMEANRRR